MRAPDEPADEVLRIQTLRALHVLDTPAEERFDRLTRLARRLYGVPIALVSLVDSERQWFKSCQGLAVSETGRDISFCGHAILGEGVFVVPDARADERFADNPLVTGEPDIRFYAGCPLRAPNGAKLGTLCIIDSQPREPGEIDVQALVDLAQMAEEEIAAVAMATMDELTLLSNRRGFDALARHTLELSRRLHTPVQLLFLDLDHFKAINDTYGHAEGDAALLAFAAVIRQTFRDSDVMARIAGDEFAVLASAAEAQELDGALDRLRQQLAVHNTGSSAEYELRFSAGSVTFDPERHANICDLMAEADELMYRQKKAR